MTDLIVIRNTTEAGKPNARVLIDNRAKSEPLRDTPSYDTEANGTMIELVSARIPFNYTDSSLNITIAELDAHYLEKENLQETAHVDINLPRGVVSFGQVKPENAPQ